MQRRVPVRLNQRTYLCAECRPAISDDVAFDHARESWPHVYALIMACWDQDPVRRPEFSLIQRTLEHDRVEELRNIVNRVASSDHLGGGGASESASTVAGRRHAGALTLRRAIEHHVAVQHRRRLRSSGAASSAASAGAVSWTPLDQDEVATLDGGSGSGGGRGKEGDEYIECSDACRLLDVMLSDPSSTTWNATKWRSETAALAERLTAPVASSSDTL